MKKLGQLIARLTLVAALLFSASPHEVDAQGQAPTPATSPSPVPMATPSNPNANCAPGLGATVQYDANYIYTCIGTNTWSRVPNGAWASPPLIPPATQIIDGSGNVWTLQGGVVFENGSPAGTSSSVILVAYTGGVIYQENSGNLWWSWNGTTWVSTTDPLGVQALSSDGFVDSIGVNTHFGDTSVYQTSFSTVAPLIGALGVRHIRENAEAASWFNGANVASLYSTYGIKFSLITGGFAAGLAQYGDLTPGDEIALVASLGGAAAVDMMEGNNEPDNQGDGTWPADTLAWQKTMWNAFKGNGTVSAIPFAGPSVCCTPGSATGGSASLTNLLPYMNYINIHRYLATNGGATYPEQDVATILGSSYALAYGSPIPLPAIVTEDGQANSATPGTDCTGCIMNYATAAQYFPRMFMSLYAAGIKRTYDYEFMDESQNSGNEAWFGLVLPSFTPKPSYYSLKNMISLLTDPGAAFTPGSLNYTLSGNGTNNVQTVLLGKRDGSFILALWQGVSTWNSTTIAAITPPSPNSVTITLPSGTPMGHYQTAALSTTSTQNSWSSLTAISGNAVTINVTPSIQLVRLAP